MIWKYIIPWDFLKLAWYLFIISAEKISQSSVIQKLCKQCKNAFFDLMVLLAAKLTWKGGFTHENFYKASHTLTFLKVLVLSGSFVY